MQDEELLKIKEEIQNAIKGNIGENDGLEDYFFSDTVFNLSNRIEVLEKGLNFASNQRKINEFKLKKDFHEFCRRMRIKWNSGNEPSQDFS